MKPLIPLAALAVLALAMPVHADLSGYLPPTTLPSRDYIGNVESAHTCAPDDPVCTVTCGLLQYRWDSGFELVDVNLPEKRVVVPGPGQGSSGPEIGHYTICL